MLRTDRQKPIAFEVYCMLELMALDSISIGIKLTLDSIELSFNQALIETHLKLSC